MGNGLAYPAQPCGLPYKQFKSGWLYRDAYEQVAWGREGARTSQRTVLRHMSKLKRDEYQRYQDDCAIGDREPADDSDEGAYAESGDTSFNFSGVQKKLPFMRKTKYGHRRARALPWPYTPPRLKDENRRRMKKEKGKRCTVAGALRTCTTDDGYINITYTPRGMNRTPVGMLDIHGAQDIGGECALEVGGVEVDVEYIDKGIGTRLYEEAAHVAAQHGCRLISDSTRSVFSEAFWRKQHRKGRAKCSAMGRGGSYYDNPLELLKNKCARGTIPKATCDKLLDPARLPKPDGHAWPCRRWILNFPPPESLAGVKKKRRK